MNQTVLSNIGLLILGGSIGWILGSIITYRFVKPYTSPETIQDWRMWLNAIEGMTDVRKARVLVKSFKGFDSYTVEQRHSGGFYVEIQTIPDGNNFSNYLGVGRTELEAIIRVARTIHAHRTDIIFENELA